MNCFIPDPRLRLRLSALSLFVCAFFVGGESIADAQFDDLLRRIPSDATAIIVMDVKGIHQSPIAVRRHWGQKHEQAYMQSPLILPPEADRIVLAADVDASNGFETEWEMAVMSLSEPIQMRSVARAESGYLDKLNGLEVAWTPSNAYFVGFEEQLLGAMFPAARKDVSRWIGFAQRNKEVLISDYLVSAAKKVNQKTQIVLAIDLKDVIDPHELSEKLNTSTVLKGNTRKAEQLFPIILGIQGVTLEVSLGTTAEGTLRVEFASDAAPFANFAKPMLFHALNNVGANIGELEKWTTKIDGKSITSTGRMSDTQLRRVFSLLEIPSTKFSTLKGEDVESPGSADQVAKKSKTYYSAVNTLIEDLRKTLEDTRDNHAVWMERYARKVDRLPLLHVDKDLLGLGRERRRDVPRDGAVNAIQRNQNGCPQVARVWQLSTQLSRHRRCRLSRSLRCRVCQQRVHHGTENEQCKNADSHRRKSESQSGPLRKLEDNGRRHSRHPPHDDREIPGRVLDKR